jgi:hypothetical protein
MSPQHCPATLAAQSDGLIDHERAMILTRRQFDDLTGFCLAKRLAQFR